MSSTDNRIVKMGFDNAEFKKGAAETQKGLADLNKAVDSAGKSKGLLDLSSNMEKVSVTASKMAIVTTTALATIANKVTNVALNMGKALTFDPIRAGFTEYESLLTKQNVIMNATGKSAREVKGFLNDLNAYSDQTIYNFGNMTDSVQKFVNAGVPLPKAVVSIKGIANAAAFAGASAQEANRGMYAFSQSMQTGYIMLQDWMQIENANMGTIAFKEELLKAGVAAGTLTKQGKGFVTESGKFVSATKGWRDGLQEQWATTEVLNRTLGKYADNTTKLGKKAFASAQDVRTFSAFMDTLKESLASGWSSIFTSLFGNLKQATSMWTGLSNAVGGVVHNFFEWLSTSLKVWRQMGGFEKTLEGFRNLLAPIAAILDVLGTAFRAAFPDSGAGSGKALYGMSAGFAAITSPLQLLADLIRGATGPLTVFFQLLKIGITVVREIATYISDFVKNALGLIDLKAPSSGGMLGWIRDFGEAIGDAVGQISDLLSKGSSIKDAFGAVSLPSLPSMPSMPSLGGAFGGGGDGGASEGVSKASASIGGLAIPLEGLGGIVQKITEFFKQFAGVTKDAGGDVASAGEVMGNVFMRVWDILSNFFEGINFQDVIEAFNLAVLSTFVLSAARLMNTLSKSFGGFLGIGESLKGVLDGAGGALQSFQTQARAKLILNIGIALLLLAGALWILSKIPMTTLATRLVALAIVFKLMDSSVESLGDMIEKMDQKGMAVKLLAFSVAIMAMASAMLILAAALILFNYVDWSSLIKGLVTMTVAMKLMEGLGNTGKLAAKNMLAGAAAIAIVSGSMLLLAAALLAFKLVDWESMGKAGVALGGIALAVGLLALIPYEGIAKVGLALLATSVGMNAMAIALLMFSKVKWGSIGKAAVTLGLLTIALAALMIVGNPVAITGLLGMAGAMVLLAGAMMVLNSVEWASIGKLALVFGVLAVALLAFTGIMYLMAPVIPVVMLFAAALGLLGLGMLAFAAAMAIAITLGAAGVAAFAALATGAAVAIAVFLQTLALEAPVMKDAFLDILQSLIDGIVEAVPMIIQGIKDLWAAVKAEFSGDDKKGQTKQAGSSWVSSAANGIKSKLPEIVKKGSELLISFLRALRSKAAEIAAAGVGLIVAVLQGIARKVGDIVAAGYQIIIKIIQGIANGLSALINAGIKIIADFLHKLADAIRNGSAAIGAGLTDVIDAMREVGVNLVKGLIAGIDDYAGEALDAMKDLAGGMIESAKDGFGIFSPSRVFKSIGKFLVQGLTLGVQNNAAAAITSVAGMVSGQIAIANEYISNFIQKLDQQSIAARAKAEGLAAAAKRAQQLAKKTKTKKDDKAAAALGGRAKQADRVADAAEKKAQRAKEAQDRKEAFEKASTLEKAKIRSADAQRELDAAKAAEKRAAKALIQAEALDKQSRAAGVTPAQRKALQAEADRLRAQARADAKASNKNLEDAKKATADALAYQKLAGDEAAAAFQAAFDADAQAAADAAAFEKMSDQEKAILRRQQAAELQAKAAKDLEEAKKLAYTDIQAANDLAALAQAEADRARQYLAEAAQLEGGTGAGGALGTVVNLDPTEAAALSMSEYSDLYDSATAAAAGARTVEFNQYNTSPESLSPSEIYRQTNNLFAHAVDQLEDAAA